LQHKKKQETLAQMRVRLCVASVTLQECCVRVASVLLTRPAAAVARPEAAALLTRSTAPAARPAASRRRSSALLTQRERGGGNGGRRGVARSRGRERGGGCDGRRGAACLRQKRERRRLRWAARRGVFERKI
jgi:hypothetical protein